MYIVIGKGPIKLVVFPHTCLRLICVHQDIKQTLKRKKKERKKENEKYNVKAKCPQAVSDIFFLLHFESFGLTKNVHERSATA